MPEKIIIHGGGGHAKVVLDCLQGMGKSVEAIIDSKYEGDLFSVKRLRSVPPEMSAYATVIAIGDNSIRKEVSAAVSNPLFTVIHPGATISRYASIGKGCMIIHQSVLQAGSSIGDHVIINTGAQVDHDCTIGSFVHIAPGAVLCGNVKVGEGTLVGAGAVIKPGTTIGAWAAIGSGTVVVRDVPDYAVVVGNPGRIIKYIQA